MKAICVLRNDDSKFGTIEFSQEKEGAATTMSVSTI